jgi:serpin B
MKTRTAFFAALSAVSLASLAACSSSSSPSVSPTPAGHQEARSALARDNAPVLTDAEKTAVSDGGYALTADLLEQFRAGGAATGNLAYSPFSVGVALSMAYVGAKGQTATEMASALHWTLPKDRVSKAYDWSTLQLATRADDAHQQAVDAAKGNPGVTVPDASNYRLHVVNSIWADKRMQFVPAFLDVMATDYGAGVTLADFAGAPETERLAINQWVSDETQAKIKDLLPPDSISPDTVTVLVNAIHLKLPWEEAFESAPKSGTFTLENDGTVTASYLNGIKDVGWYENADATVVSIPLAGGKNSLILALPKAALPTLEDKIDGAWLSAMHAGLKPSSVDVTFPKFKFETPSLSLAAALKAMGMKAAFVPGQADFTGMGSTGKPIVIGDVLHKAMIGVDEKGVEAAAATAVTFVDSSVPTAQHTFKADRPFFFAIVDEPTKSVLFAGHVNDPTK